MTATTLIARCRELGIILTSGPEGKLRVSPRGLLPDDLRTGLKQQKAEVLALLTPHLPYINHHGDLIIPFGCDPKYHYWKQGGQNLALTLQELNAPAEVWKRYLGTYTETTQ
jgi:hypothetical protein